MLRADPVVLAAGQCFATDDDYKQARRSLLDERIGLVRALDQHRASLLICESDPAVVVIDLAMTDGSPLAVADFCNYRRPDVPVILIGAGRLLADGSLFRHVGNAAALVSRQTPARDLTALIAFHASHRLSLA